MLGHEQVRNISEFPEFGFVRGQRDARTNPQIPLLIKLKVSLKDNTISNATHHKKF